MKAYHFLRADMTAGNSTEPAWTVGETRTYQGKIELCNSGYHSSPSWLNALRYAPGAMACIVDVSKPVVKSGDEQVSKRRTLIAARDASRSLRFFACDCDERALKRANVTDERCWNAIRVSRLFADGKATLEELAAARLATRLAVGAAAGDAVWVAEIRWQKRRLNKYMRELFEEVSR